MRIQLLRLTAALGVALAAACGDAPAAPARASAAPGAQAQVASDFSVHELTTLWRNQEGEPTAFASFAGAPQVVAMVYTSCSHTCPRILTELKQMEAALPAGDRTRFVLVSLDPARDQPGTLKEYATSLRLDPARWTLLTGTEDEVRELAALLGIRYREEAGDEISHSNAYLVLDGAGRIVHRQEGLGAGIGAPLAAIRRAGSAE